MSPIKEKLFFGDEEIALSNSFPLTSLSSLLISSIFGAMAMDFLPVSIGISSSSSSDSSDCCSESEDKTFLMESFDFFAVKRSSCLFRSAIVLY
jgi:hypothetical protein